MPPKLSPVPPERVIRALKSLGFSIVRQKGSHAILKNARGKLTVVPVHKGEDIGPGLLMKIIRDAEVTKEEFMKLV